MITATMERQQETEVSRVHELSEWLKVIAEPNRLRILDLLMQGEQCNCEMGVRLGMAPNLISHHLGVLQKEGLVRARRDPDDGRWIHYSIDTAGLDRLQRAFGSFFDTARVRLRRPECPPASSFMAAKDLGLVER